jgi:hypothetical protein
MKTRPIRVINSFIAWASYQDTQRISTRISFPHSAWQSNGTGTLQWPYTETGRDGQLYPYFLTSIKCNRLAIATPQHRAFLEKSRQVPCAPTEWTRNLKTKDVTNGRKRDERRKKKANSPNWSWAEVQRDRKEIDFLQAKNNNKRFQPDYQHM